jgi:hypothetical protein
MKKAIIILTVIAWTVNAVARENPAKDLDSDKIPDTVYFDFEKSVIVCRLSSHDFEPIESLPVEITNGQGTSVSGIEDGFYFANHWMRAGYENFFRYEPETKKIRLVAMSRYELGNAANDGSGESSVDLLTGEYVGNWNYYDMEKNSLIKIPAIETTMPFPETYLEDFGEETYFGYAERCAELYYSHKEKMMRSSLYANSKEKYSGTPYMDIHLQSAGLKNNFQLRLAIYDEDMSGGFVQYRGQTERMPIQFDRQEVAEDRSEEGRPDVRILFYNEIYQGEINGVYVLTIQGANVYNASYLRKKDGKKFSLDIKSQ